MFEANCKAVKINSRSRIAGGDKFYLRTTSRYGDSKQGDTVRFLISWPAAVLTIFSLFSNPSTAISGDNGEVVRVCYLNWGKQGGTHLPEQGFVPDLLATVLKRAGYEPVIDIIDWNQCLQKVRDLEYDFVGSYWIGGPGDAWYDYFLPTTVDRINFITTKSTGLTSGEIEDLYGKRIGILKGAGGLTDFKDQASSFEVFESPNDIEMMEKLQAGEIDAIVSNSPHIVSLAETSYPDLATEIVVLQPPLQTNIASPAIAIDNPRRKEMKRRYNDAYLNLVREGIYPRLMEKHEIRVDHKMTPRDRQMFRAAQK